MAEIKLPAQYQWLLKEPGPKMLKEALKFYGLKEIPGKESNPVIIGWAKEFGIEDIYTNDDMAWCALAHAKVAKDAGKVVPYTDYELLRAASWLNFGHQIKPEDAILGDTLIFKRPGGYHVGLYVGEDKKCYHTFGGNQSNSYNITRLLKSRLIAVRQPIYNNMPPNARKVYLTANGNISKNES